MTAAAARPARLTVGVVGAGRVGTALASALHSAGHEVVAVSGVSAASQRRAAERLPGVPVLSPSDVVRRAALVLVTPPDDQLAGVVRGLAEGGDVRAGQLVVHCSGRYGLEVLEPAVELGALPLALHPVMTFLGAAEDVDRLVGATFGVTAPDVLRPVAEALVLEMHGEPVWVPEGERPLYHAALALGANYLVTLVNEASDLLRAAGVEQPSRLLAPLLSASLDNALLRGDAALTGPVARGDADTVAAHLTALRRTAPTVVPAYVAMARLTAERALQSGRLSAVAAERLLDVLAAPHGAGAQA
ncbi:MAG: Rossmann-like and DUF2520 domain-containing protein [Mycobacteriales bacterium]|nr:DUF2520 domain-containing protein [Frankia sp.]